MLRALALLSLYIPYLVQAKQQYQHKYAQLYPHAHDSTFLKAYKSPRVFIPCDYCRTCPRRPDPTDAGKARAPNRFRKCCKKSKKKSTRRSIFLQPRLLYGVTRLTVSDVHRDFEAETQISRCRCSPCHDYLLVVLRGVINSLYLRLHKTADSGWIMHPRPGLSHERIP